MALAHVDHHRRAAADRVTLRDGRIEEDAADPTIAVVLFDVVFGYGVSAGLEQPAGVDPQRPLAATISDDGPCPGNSTHYGGSLTFAVRGIKPRFRR